MLAILLTLLPLPAAADDAPAQDYDSSLDPSALSGAWKIVMEVVTAAKLPVFGPARITTTTTLLASLDMTTGIQRHTTCRIEPSSPLRMVTTTIPDAFVRSLAEPSYTVQLTPGTKGWGYRADFGPQHIAYDPARSPGGPPARADDPAVIDWEGDGKPGATVLLDAPMMGRSEVYITQLAHTRLVGRVVDENTITGKLDVVALEQRSIGARPVIFATNPEVKTVPGASRFTMTRLPEGSRCSQL